MQPLTPKVKILALGGAAINALPYIRKHLQVENLHIPTLAIDTDCLCLQNSTADHALPIGHHLTRGLSTGANPDTGNQAATDDIEKIEAELQDLDILFLLTGLGGGTGSGAAPVIAETARKNNALVIAITPLPFSIEGSARQRTAQTALSSLRKHAHALIPLPNDLLLQNADPATSVIDAFNLSHSWTLRAIQSLLDTLTKPGLINLDLAALHNLLDKPAAKTLFAIADLPIDSLQPDAIIEQLLLCPLLHTPEASQVADNLLIHLCAGPQLALAQVNTIADTLANRFKSKNNTLIGASLDPSLSDSVRITLIGTTTNKSTRAQNSPSRDSTPTQQVLFDDTEAQSDPTERGYFESASRTQYAGIDLDIPTYLRKGIKIRL